MSLRVFTALALLRCKNGENCNLVVPPFAEKHGTSSSPTTSVIMTNELSNHIDPAVSWTDKATITLESASSFNIGASERSRSLCPSMNAIQILWSGADRFGWEARAGDGGLWVG